MAATPANSLNITQTGIQIFDGVATFSATTTTQYNTLVGNTGNTITNIGPGTTAQVLTSNGASANPSYQTLPFTKMPWTDKATSFAAASQNGYFVSATAIATMPAAPAQGDVISFIVDSLAGILTITANTGQFLRIGKVLSASAGIAVSNFDGDAVTFYYRASDTTWISLDIQGTFTVT